MRAEVPSIIQNFSLQKNYQTIKVDELKTLWYNQLELPGFFTILKNIDCFLKIEIICIKTIIERITITTVIMLSLQYIFSKR